MGAENYAAIVTTTMHTKVYDNNTYYYDHMVPMHVCVCMYTCHMLWK